MRVRLKIVRHLPARSSSCRFLSINTGKCNQRTDAHSKHQEKTTNDDLLRFYRNKGYLEAHLDPLRLSTSVIENETEESVSSPFASLSSDTVSSAVIEVYTQNSSLEAGHLENSFERNWLFNEFEKLKLTTLNSETKSRIAEVIMNGEEFDRFTAAKFPTVKRYGGEGAESMLAFCDSLFANASEHESNAIVVGIAHRGRNNLLTTLLNCPPALLFRKMKGLSGVPENSMHVMDDDVLSHIRTSVDFENGVSVTLLPNPSHLEAVNPVVQGKVWSKQNMRVNSKNKDKNDFPGSLSVLIHGDGAFAGQGVVAECFNMAYVPGYDVGGSVHLITNNQVAFTMQRGFSHRHASDLAKMINCPIVHVNGDSPEEAYKAAILCLKYRALFGKDIVCNLVCYRKWGHNEMDDATITQPLMYEVINSKKSPPNIYFDKISAELPAEYIMQLTERCKDFKNYLNEQYKSVDKFQPVLESFQNKWQSCNFAPDQLSTWDTGFELQTLKYIGIKSVSVPEHFNTHSKLVKTLSTRINMMNQEDGIDWATAEALAFGSLMIQGHDVRLSGEDVGRGTFSHRHCQLVDQSTNEIIEPLNEIRKEAPDSGILHVANSILSEEAVLGFDYGVSIDSPKTLVVWEAQFGDFFNGAQIIIDAFIASGESKWGMQSGIVLLLPHGLDGMGPEHSSCRLERFLQLTDSSETSIDSDRVNMFIVNPTTPAQYFHLLRRQQARNFRKPLIVASPKKLIRLPEAKSNLSELASGTHFKPVLDDGNLKVEASSVTKVIFVCGKLFYSLEAERETKKLKNVAIVRIEQLVPFPTSELQSIISKYSNCEQFVWCQEEHRNSGAWTFVEPRFRNLVGVNLDYIGRSERAVPATAIGTRHKTEEAEILQTAFAK
ncbi:putative 2-oxoadipate dehydrogenase complex component E1 homolog [Convolutriloba macropyga]|uniref:putative 2-oxoadipate dehydrogenase complex component E1 homolog n=1 Tax=Convolutriloba macropyga TaxID=536237 RepID=UPI003F51F9E5